MASKWVTVFGGSGFLGRQIVKSLAAEGANVRVAVRHPERASFLDKMIAARHRRRQEMAARDCVGADKGCNTKDFVEELRDLTVRA